MQDELRQMTYDGLMAGEVSPGQAIERVSVAIDQFVQTIHELGHEGTSPEDLYAQLDSAVAFANKLREELVEHAQIEERNIWDALTQRFREGEHVRWADKPGTGEPMPEGVIMAMNNPGDVAPYATVSRWGTGETRSINLSALEHSTYDPAD